MPSLVSDIVCYYKTLLVGGGGGGYVCQLSEFQTLLFHILRVGMALSVLINPFLCCLSLFHLVLMSLFEGHVA